MKEYYYTANYFLRKKLCSLTMSFLLLLMLIIPSHTSAQEILDEVAFKYTKPNLLTGHLNPLVMGHQGFIFLNAYEPLAIDDDVSLSKGVLYRPILAESWYWIDDFNFEIKLRRIACFRSGRAVTAEDVVFSIETEFRADISGVLSPYAEYFEDVRKVDDYTLRLKLKEEYPRNKNVFRVISSVRVVPKYRWAPLLDELGTGIIDYPNDNPEEWDASGPYTLLSYKPEALILKRVENYWGEKLGWLFAPEYAIKYGDPSSDVLFRMFDAHQRDLSSQSPEVSVEWQRARISYLGAWDIHGDPRTIHGISSDSHCLTLNYARHPVFREKWFREALFYAIDYNKIIEAGFYGQAAPGTPTTLHPFVFKDYANMFSDVVKNTFRKVVYDGGVWRPLYDPELAIQILKENCDPGSSVENGWYYKGEKIGGWTVTTVVAWRCWVVTAEIVSQNLREIGISCDPNPVELSTYYDIMNSMDFDIITNWCSARGTPIGIEEGLSNDFCNPGLGPWWQGKSPGGFQIFWNGEYPPLPNISSEVKKLVDELWKLEYGTAEFNQTLRSVLELVVPQMAYIPTDIVGGFHLYNHADRWTNWPAVDDPYEFRLGDNGDGVSYHALKHVYPVKVETLSFELSDEIVEVGTTVTATVTLKNNGQYAQRYKVVINKGPAEREWELFEENVLAWKIVNVPPGTLKVSIPITIEEPGTYVLVVDNWRIGVFDVGEPLEKILTVTTPTPAQTITITKTVTSTSTVTSEVAVPTVDVASVAGAGIVALIVGVAVGWLVGSRRKT